MRRDDGMTLVELLIAIALAGLLMAGLASVFVVSSKTQNASFDMLSDQTAADDVTLYFARDVQSAIPPAQLGVTTSCGDAAVVLLRWTDAVSGHRFEAAYTRDGDVLRRSLCADLGAGYHRRAVSRLMTNVQSAEAALVTSAGGRTGVRLLIQSETGQTIRARAYHRQP